MSILSVIVVRKGSSGLKEKCIQEIDNKAVFEYTVEYSIALNRKIEEEVFTVVSSDSEIVKQKCLANNINFLARNPLLATATAKIEDVIYDVYLNIGKSFDYISLLYGNIPLRYPAEFLKAYNFLLEHKDYDCVLSMQNVEKFNPLWMFELNEDILPIKKSSGYRRQDLKQQMIHDGHTILFRAKHFLEFMGKRSKQNTMYAAFGKKIKPLLSERVIIDIDTKKDLELATAILNFINREKK